MMDEKWRDIVPTDIAHKRQFIPILSRGGDAWNQFSPNRNRDEGRF